MKTNGVTPRLQRLSPTISEILSISGAAGASIGILHDGEIETKGFGYRDVANRLKADENTTYHIASLSKSFTAAALGILVDENKLCWDQKVSDVLSDFKHFDETVRTESTILDFLSHRTGLATKGALWRQDGPRLLLDHEDLLPTVSYLEVIEPMGTKWIYNNWNYDVAGQLIEQASGMSYTSFISSRILDPLGLSNTSMEKVPPNKNWAHGYMPAPDGEFTDVGRPVISEGTLMQAAGGLKSTVNDLLTYYGAVLCAWRSEITPEKGVTDTPLRNIATLVTGHIPLDPKSEFKQWYGAGWAMADLPAPLGSIGTNGIFVKEMPVVGKGGKKKRVWYHNGSLVGFFSSVHILPETGDIIVVLVNSIPKNDCADWLGQLLLEDILNNPSKNDYVSLARDSAGAYDKMWIDLQDEFAKPCPPIPGKPRPLSHYTGRYYNKPGNWFIEVVEANQTLMFAFQGRASQCHSLQPRGEDIFGWPMTEEESRKRARWPDLDKAIYLFTFSVDEKGVVSALTWLHDRDVPDGEAFTRANRSVTRTSPA